MMHFMTVLASQMHFSSKFIWIWIEQQKNWRKISVLSTWKLPTNHIFLNIFLKNYLFITKWVHFMHLVINHERAWAEASWIIWLSIKNTWKKIKTHAIYKIGRFINLFCSLFIQAARVWPTFNPDLFEEKYSNKLFNFI